MLRERADDERARGIGEALEFVEVLGDVMARVGALDRRADQDGPLLGGVEFYQGLDLRSEVGGGKCGNYRKLSSRPLPEYGRVMFPNGVTTLNCPTTR